MRMSLSPCFTASVTCIWMQKAQPLICDARSFTSSTRLCSRPEFSNVASTASMPFIASGAAWKIFIRGVIGLLLFAWGLSGGGGIRPRLPGVGGGPYREQRDEDRGQGDRGEIAGERGRAADADGDFPEVEERMARQPER